MKRYRMLADVSITQSLIARVCRKASKRYGQRGSDAFCHSKGTSPDLTVVNAVQKGALFEQDGSQMLSLDRRVYI